MLRLGNRNKEIGISRNFLGLFSIFYFLVSSSCGVAVHNVGASSGLVQRPIHRLAFELLRVVDNNRFSPMSFTRAYSFLYAVYEQYYNISSSVKPSFVHIFHSPYIKSYDSNKGIYLEGGLSG
jgi:hypothetical protein